MPLQSYPKTCHVSNKSPSKVSRYKFQVAGDVQTHVQNFMVRPGSAEQVVIFRKDYKLTFNLLAPELVF